MKKKQPASFLLLIKIMYNRSMKTALFVRSCYSLLQSLLTPEAIAKKAKELGYESVALVDEKVLIAGKEFQKACQKYDIKALYGLSFLWQWKNDCFRVFFLAKNDNGYRRLMKLSSFLTAQNSAYALEDISIYGDDNYLIFHSDDAPLSLESEEGFWLSYQELKQKVGSFLISLSDNDKAFNRKNNKLIQSYLEQKEIPYLCLSRTFYEKATDADAYRVLLGIQEKKTWDDQTLPHIPHRYFLHREEAMELYPEKGMRYNDYIASQCNVSLKYITSLPIFPVPQKASGKDYLVALCRAGLKKRLQGKNDKRYEVRLHQELQIIISMGFVDYFLIVYDYIRFAKNEKILVGPGRGSAAGSLVAYCLGIVDIDPIKYGLLFERFLNPERITMPDIDVDFPHDRRDEVIAYVRQKYGKEHVAHILTLGTLKARQVLRDVGKILKIPTYEIDVTAKLIPSATKIYLEECYEKIPYFAQRMNSSAQNKEWYRYALALENLPRDLSLHAAGIVMAREELQSILPVISLDEEVWATQYTAAYLEELGLIKMDFLGLKNLSILAEIVAEIQKVDTSFRLSEIPLNSQKVFALLASGNTLGVFQLESEGMTKLCKRMQPKTFEEIAMMLALFRPGPMENIDDFLQNRKNPHTIIYLHDDLRPILEETYGIILYQEQIMSIARKMAGFSFAKADILRHAMAKKKREELEALRQSFVEGCIQNHYSCELAQELYGFIFRFADYGFNKSHSVAYSLIAYQLAYLKAHYPLFFYKALLSGTIGDEAKTYAYLQELHKQKIKVLPLDIHLSQEKYSIEKQALRLPLSLVKGVGYSTVKIILESRRLKPFPKELFACMKHLKSCKVPQDALENLIRGGAFDSYQKNRKTLLHPANMEMMLLYGEFDSQNLLSNNFDLSPDIQVFIETKEDTARYEWQAFGFYFSVNPFREIKEKNQIECSTLSEIRHRKGYQTSFARVDKVRKHKTRNGQWMAFLKVSDGESVMDLVVMPTLLSQLQDKLVKGCYILFEGVLEKEDSCLVKKVNVIE